MAKQKEETKKYPEVEVQANVGPGDRRILGKLKGAVVDKLENPKTGRSTQIRLDRRSMTFWCEIGDVTAKSKSGQEIRWWAQEELARTDPSTRLEWFPVIQVEVKNHDRGYYKGDTHINASVGLEIDRYYVAEAVKGKEWVELPWAECDPSSPTCLDEDEKRGNAKSFWKVNDVSRRVYGGHDKPFRLPMGREKYGDAVYYLPFDAATWAGLQLLVNTIKNARKDLEALLSTKQGFAALSAIGEGRRPAGLLSAG